MSRAEGIAARADDFRPRSGHRVAVLVPCFNEDARHRQGGGGFPRRAAARRPSTSTTTIRPTAPPRSPARPARWCGGRPTRARATWCGGCSPTSTPTSTCWSTATPPTTRPARRAMIARLLEDRLDMVVAARVEEEQAAYRRGHRTGNRLLTGFVASVFGATFTDMLSGYRVFSRRFVKSFPVLSRRLRDRDRADRSCARARAAGRRDRRRPTTRGRKARCRSSAPGATASASCAPSSSSIARSGRSRSSPASASRSRIVSIGFAIPIFITYLRAGHRAAPADRDPVDRADAAGVSVGRSPGLVLDTVTRGRREMKLLAYLEQRAPGEDWDRRQTLRSAVGVRELVRTNDAVLVSAIEALLEGAEIHACRARPEHERARRLARHAAAPHPGGRGPRGGRAPAADGGRPRSRAAPRCPRMTVRGDVTEDAVLGGRLRLRQPQARAIASATTRSCWRRPARRARASTSVDLGAGVGAAGLALAARVPDATVTLVEIDPELAALAAENAERNDLAGRVRVAVLDVAAPARAFAAAGLAPESVARVLMNPPFNDPARQRASPDRAAPPRPCGRARYARPLGQDRGAAASAARHADADLAGGRARRCAGRAGAGFRSGDGAAGASEARGAGDPRAGARHQGEPGAARAAARPRAQRPRGPPDPRRRGRAARRAARADGTERCRIAAMLRGTDAVHASGRAELGRSDAPGDGAKRQLRASGLCWRRLLLGIEVRKRGNCADQHHQQVDLHRFPSIILAAGRHPCRTT